MIASIADVTALKRAEAQREEALAFVSHDLRSPAASIMILTEAYLHGGLQLTTDQLMAEFRRLAQRTLDISEAFVQVSRAESEVLDLQRVDARVLIDEAVRDVTAQADVKKVAIERMQPEVPARIDGDRALLQRAIVNLLNNAVKFSPPESAVQVTLAQRDGFWLVGVRDHGPGISGVDHDRLFSKFQRLGNSKDATSAGVGLGLVFVDQVARRHGGRVHIESTPAKGALFELLVPTAAEVSG